jgi:hypothetical protein
MTDQSPTPGSPTAGELLPPDPPGLQPLHTRDYQVRAFKVDDSTIIIRGAVRDTKPPGLYIDDDPDPLPIHHMVVELTVSWPDLTITDAATVFEVHPQTRCPAISPSYHQLVGLSIARGFTNKVRTMFGGPRGCTHVTALLLAMAPVAIQCNWSMRVAKTRELGDPPRPDLTPEMRETLIAPNLNTCHVWDEDAEFVNTLRSGGDIEMPVQVSRRLTELGRDPSEWFRRRG